VDSLLKFLDVDLHNKQITLCGNYGDPIYHPNLLEAVEAFKARGATVAIHTNGSYQKIEWWEKLCSMLDQSDRVIFGVDGSPDNFTQYRINADWESIHTAMKIVAKSSCKSTWQYSVFSYNQYDIESTRLLSQQIGIDHFSVTLSDRFDAQTEYLKPTTGELLGSRYQSQVIWKQNSAAIQPVDAKCTNGKEHYISAEGYYVPCCFAADHRFYYKNIFGKNKEQYNINNVTFTEILKSQQVAEFYQNLENTSVCQYNCPNTPLVQNS
jgi:hypothetical protein